MDYKSCAKIGKIWIIHQADSEILANIIINVKCLLFENNARAFFWTFSNEYKTIGFRNAFLEYFKWFKIFFFKFYVWEE